MVFLRNGFLNRGAQLFFKWAITAIVGWGFEMKVETILRVFRRHIVAVLMLSLLPSLNAEAKGGGGGHSLGVVAGSISTEQEHINTLISRANTREGGISTGALNSAYEVGAFYGYRFDGSMIAFQLRPTFFYQSEDGAGASGKFEYSVIGFTFFPSLRLYPLENEFMKFFMQFGLGYGRANSQIKEGPNDVKFAGGAFGTLMGMGAEFCFSPSHCLSVEGNVRYLVIERNIASSVSGDFTTSANSVSQAEQKKEVEFDGSDLATRMSGIQFLLGYTFYF